MVLGPFLVPQPPGPHGARAAPWRHELPGGDLQLGVWRRGPQRRLRQEALAGGACGWRVGQPGGAFSWRPACMQTVWGVSAELGARPVRSCTAVACLSCHPGSCTRVCHPPCCRLGGTLPPAAVRWWPRSWLPSWTCSPGSWPPTVAGSRVGGASALLCSVHGVPGAAAAAGRFRLLGVFVRACVLTCALAPHPASCLPGLHSIPPHTCLPPAACSG